MQAKYEKPKTAMQDIAMHVNGHVEKVNKIQDIVNRHMLQWLPGQQAELVSILMQIDEQFKYFSDQMKKIIDFMQVCTQHREPHSLVRMISALKEFLTYK